MEFWIFLGVVALLGLWLVAIYNKLVGYRVECENAWSQIDVQLKRRADLIPNLVETVKGYMKHEQETLTRVVEARGRALGAGSFDERVKAEGEISGLLGRLLAVWENYPELKADQHAVRLQEELSSTENRIAYARGHYNDVTSNYNTLSQQFPSNVVAGTFGFKARPFFEVPETDKAAPQVAF